MACASIPLVNPAIGRGAWKGKRWNVLDWIAEIPKKRNNENKRGKNVSNLIDKKTGKVI